MTLDALPRNRSCITLKWFGMLSVTGVDYLDSGAN